MIVAAAAGATRQVDRAATTPPGESSSPVGRQLCADSSGYALLGCRAVQAAFTGRGASSCTGIVRSVANIVMPSALISQVPYRLMTKICEGRVVIVTGAERARPFVTHSSTRAKAAQESVNDYGGAARRQRTIQRSSERGGQGDSRHRWVKAVANADDVASWNGAALTRADRARRVRWARRAGEQRRLRAGPDGRERRRGRVGRGRARPPEGRPRPLDHDGYWRDRSKAGEVGQGEHHRPEQQRQDINNVTRKPYRRSQRMPSLTLTLVEKRRRGTGRYGVTANAIARPRRAAPHRRRVCGADEEAGSGFDVMDPANVSPLVVWLGSTRERGVTGQVFEPKGAS